VTVVAVVGAVGVTPDVGVVDGVGVFTGVCVVCGGTVVPVGVGVAVTVAVGVGVTVGGVTVGVGVSVAVTVGVGLVVTVGVAVGCCDGVAVGFGRGVAVGFTVGVARGRPDGPVVPVERRAVVFVPLARARSVLLATGVGEHTLTVAVMVAVVPAEATRAVAVREAALSNVFRGGPAYISLDHHVAPVIAKSRDILMQMSTKAKNTPRLRPPCPFLFQRTINISIMLFLLFSREHIRHWHSIHRSLCPIHALSPFARSRALLLPVLLKILCISQSRAQTLYAPVAVG